jgi:sodium transport system ATP-binding protein
MTDFYAKLHTAYIVSLIEQNRQGKRGSEMIEVKEVTKRFKEIVAVDQLSFTAVPGEVLGLLGENGAGKTTTMRMMATVIRPSEGDISIDGYSAATRQMEVQKRIGILFGSDVGLYSRLTARENIAYFGRLYDMDEQQLAKRTSFLSSMLEMDEFMDRRVGTFSRGMKQKVAIARSLVHDPPVILLDEPTTGLDVTSASVFHHLIKDLKQQGKTILFSSHNMGEVEKLCQRVVIMHKGKQRYIGTIHDLRKQTGLDDLDEIFIQVTKEGESHE